MTRTLVRQHPSRLASPPAPADACTRARDWSEIQERMLVPLYEAVYERLEVGPTTRLLGLGCGSGLALLMAANRGASVAGVEHDEHRLDLARERLVSPPPSAEGAKGARGASKDAARLLADGPDDPGDGPDGLGTAFDLVTVFDPLGCPASGPDELPDSLALAVRLVKRGSPIVLADWGPPERCSTASVLRGVARLPEPLRHSATASTIATSSHASDASDPSEDSAGDEPAPPGGWQPSRRDHLEDLALRAGLRPDGSGRVACPFGYADMGSAVRGLLSTGLFDIAVEATDQEQVEKELEEALHPHLREDGTVWMANIFRYLIARA
ncbi:SAM-dependent methyltransferase [Streptomyces sp. H27-D2]|uniref:SAM-dependent methyltransferase n=1 Tax=Streptomyces sp. H27-D2 TaxID=3046304 RepID=UPI002DBA1741|nr:SAM-dependent methyltransferase [Streptomyces sp. H27-D2]MEC4018042.1 SAM-dependent methyltransferase [Streptomyces sp. H27-D2]